MAGAVAYCLGGRQSPVHRLDHLLHLIPQLSVQHPPLPCRLHHHLRANPQDIAGLPFEEGQLSCLAGLIHRHILDAVAFAEIAHLLVVNYLFEDMPFVYCIFLEGGIRRDDVVLLRMFGVFEGEAEGH